MQISVDYEVLWSHAEYGTDVLLDASKPDAPLQFMSGQGKVISQLEECASSLEIGQRTTTPINLHGDFIGNIYNVPPGASLQLNVKRVKNQDSIEHSCDAEQIKPTETPIILARVEKWPQCVEEAASLKQQGNDLFIAEEHLQAKAKYLRALHLLRRASKLPRESNNNNNSNHDNKNNSQGTSKQDQSQHSQLWMSCLLNASACELKLNEATHALRHTTLALSHEPDNVKAMFRRAEALEQLQELVQAKEVLNCAFKLDPTNKAVAKTLVRVRASIEVENDLAQKMAKNMFASS